MAALSASAQDKHVKLVKVADAWARNSVNTVVFRHNSLVTFKGTQYTAFYDGDQRLVLAKRKSGAGKWESHITQFKGNAMDAHRSISIMLDGDGFIHVSWDHHNNPLNYARSVRPGSLQLTAKMPMTGIKEKNATYPEFYSLPDGGLMFLYRDGQSGNGDLMLNRYNVKEKKWTQVQDGWINGEGRRNAYWQMTTDNLGTIHLSWVWRETGDVATNHDLCYARSKDGGKTWEKSTGERYKLPITAATAEYAARIPQNSELINSTSMAADNLGRPYIATYWRSPDANVPQYRLVYHDGTQWTVKQISERKTPFSLSGGGTKRIPIARPQLVVSEKNGVKRAAMIYRDEERGAKVSIAFSSDLEKGAWTTSDLTSFGVGSWEPSYDTELWKQKNRLDIFVENVEQGDGETVKELAPQPVYVLSWKF
ncbi:neuraminidase [Pedobacter sp. HMF7056]|uniref:Neuraminidase n=2 Tax=Hufsiella ginkgonis TaxID=2695274 RepID=A0A7K1Y1X4_9SPHI|nr:neuraminidase [Hufsiella ginkgonis]